MKKLALVSQIHVNVGSEEDSGLAYFELTHAISFDAAAGASVASHNMVHSDSESD
jgi:hypothetical protein